MTNVPNYKQTEHIVNDLALLASGRADEIQDWHGNGCTGHAWNDPSIKTWYYDLAYKGTVIAYYTASQAGIDLADFDTTRYSAECRKFQDRILSAYHIFSNRKETT